MPQKSFVAMAQRVCQVCGVKYDANELILDKHMRERFNQKELIGWGVCPACDKLNTDGYIALVGVKGSPSTGKMSLEDADRTGMVIHMRRPIFKDFFGVEDEPGLLAFVDQGTLDRLKEQIESNSSEGGADDKGN